MPQLKKYTYNRCIEKVIICIAYMFVGAASITLVVGIIALFLGANATTYLTEALLKHPNCHDKV